MSLTSPAKNDLKEGSLGRIHYLMGALLSIEVSHPEEACAREALAAAFSEVRRLESVLSRFKDGSPVYRLNHSAHLSAQPLDDELFSLIAACLESSAKTLGAFDISVSGLMELWSQAEKNDALPEDGEVRSFLSGTGYQNIVLDKEAKTVFFKNPLLKIDFGAIGKGYALDRAVAILKQRGIEKARLDFGGHLYYFNRSDTPAPHIGLKNPLLPDEVILTLPFENKTISTSANFERNFKIRNKIYGHLINPFTGYPAQGPLLSVSVISSSALEADVFSTAAFILGPEEGMRLIRNSAGNEAVFITDSYGKPKIHVSFDLK